MPKHFINNNYITLSQSAQFMKQLHLGTTVKLYGILSISIMYVMYYPYILLLYLGVPISTQNPKQYSTDSQYYRVLERVKGNQAQAVCGGIMYYILDTNTLNGETWNTVHGLTNNTGCSRFWIKSGESKFMLLWMPFVMVLMYSCDLIQFHSILYFYTI